MIFTSLIKQLASHTTQISSSISKCYIKSLVHYKWCWLQEGATETKPLLMRWPMGKHIPELRTRKGRDSMEIGHCLFSLLTTLAFVFSSFLSWLYPSNIINALFHFLCFPFFIRQFGQLLTAQNLVLGLKQAHKFFTPQTQTWLHPLKKGTLVTFSLQYLLLPHFLLFQ